MLDEGGLGIPQDQERKQVEVATCVGLILSCYDYYALLFRASVVTFCHAFRLFFDYLTMIIS